MSSSVSPSLSSSLNRPRSERGSVLVASLILSIGIAIALASYLQLGRTALDLSNRAFYANVATNLAETGLEHGMWVISRGVASASSPWEPSGTGADLQAKFTNFTYSGNVTGDVRVYLEDPNSASPVVYARSSVTPYKGSAIEKWIKVELNRVAGVQNSSTVSFPITGIVAPYLDVSGGTAVMDSYSQEPYELNRDSNIRVTVLSPNTASADFQNSKIYGYITVENSEALKIKENKVSIISGDLDANAGTRDMTRVNYDAKLNVPEPVAPDTEGYKVLDLSSEVPEGNYIIDKIILDDDPSISAYSTLKIAENADVTIVITDSSVSDFGLAAHGKAEIIIPESSTLTIYTQSGVHLGGTSVSNSGDPANFVLYGTRSVDSDPAQKMTLGGNGVLSAVVYAPGADITLNGGGSKGQFKGGVVGGRVTLNGGVIVSWHEGLGSINVTTSLSTTSSVLRIGHWEELAKASERAAIAEKFEF